MEPIRYVDRLNALYRSQGFRPYQWSVYDTAPLTPLSKPLNQCRVSLLTSGGVSHQDLTPFNPMARNDLRLDAVAHDTPAQCFVINDAYYNHQDADRDINCIFPLKRLRARLTRFSSGRFCVTRCAPWNQSKREVRSSIWPTNGAKPLI